MKSRWNQTTIKDELLRVMKVNGWETLPSRQQLDAIGRSDLCSAIARFGGFRKIASQIGVKAASGDRRVKWTLEDIERELKEYIAEKSLQFMPSKPDLIKAGRCDLGNAITRYKNIRYWSERLGVPLKESETKTGREYEDKMIDTLRRKGFQVEDMSTKHPYDLLVNGTVKIDVKVGMAHRHFGTRGHTFATNKKHPTCDIYVCVALDEEGNTEKSFVIPSKFAQLVTLNICGEGSKYNAFIDRWDYIDRFSEFYDSVGIAP